MRHNLIKRLPIVMLLTAICASSFAEAGTKTKEKMVTLFEPVTKVNFEGKYKARHQVKGSLPIQIKTELIASLKEKQEVVIPLSEKLTAVGVMDKLEKRSGSQYSWFGHLKDVIGGTFIIVVEKDAVVGTIQAPSFNLLYDIMLVHDNIYSLDQIDSALMPVCGGGVHDPNETAVTTETPPNPENPPNPVLMTPGPDGAGNVSAASIAKPINATTKGLIQQKGTPMTLPANLSSGSSAVSNVNGGAGPGTGGFQTRTSCSPPQTVFDMMILYTTNAKNAAGGLNAINGRCQLAIDETNVAYYQSGINARTRLVIRYETTYNETGQTFQTDLDRLTNYGDGFIDEAQLYRNGYHADQVSLWIDDSAYCGLGWCQAAENHAYTVVDWPCATGYYSYAHEFGHNQGCEHDRQNAGSGCAKYSYSYGWRFYGNSGNQYRTIMSYAPGTRIQYFSNPYVAFDGVATGVPAGQTNESYNAATIANTASTVEGFRITAEDVWVNMNWGGYHDGTYYYPFNSVVTGKNAIVPGYGPSEPCHLHLKSSTSYEHGFTISTPMIIDSCGGSSRIGG